jgi:uncharacterized protein
MQYEWDEEKSRTNEAKDGISFEAVRSFDWATAVTDVDDREDYGELRETATGFIGLTLYYLVYVVEDDEPETIRVISLRAANKAEARRYANERRE